MVNQPTPPPNEVGQEITESDLKRQEFEQDLSRSNWWFFWAKEESPPPGSSRTDEPDSEPDVN